MIGLNLLTGTLLKSRLKNMNDSEKGIKYDNNKLRYDLLPSYPLEQLVKVYTYGAQRYTDNNWRKGLKWSRVFAAIMRHLWSWWKDEDNDPESNISHLAHAAWGCFTLLEYTQNKKRFDDRYKLNNKKSKGIVI